MIGIPPFGMFVGAYRNKVNLPRTECGKNEGKMSSTTEVVRRVYDDKNRVFLEIGPDADTGTALELRTTSKLSKEWFGDIRIVMERGYAKTLGEALIAASEESSKVTTP